MEREVELEHRALEASNALARIQVKIVLYIRCHIGSSAFQVTDNSHGNFLGRA